MASNILKHRDMGEQCSLVQAPGDEPYPGELVQDINTLELLANGAALKQVELGLEGLPGEGGELDQVLMQKNHPLHHLSESLSPLTIHLPGTSLPRVSLSSLCSILISAGTIWMVVVKLLIS